MKKRCGLSYRDRYIVSGVRGVVVCATVRRAGDAWFDSRRLSDKYIMCAFGFSHLNP